MKRFFHGFLLVCLLGAACDCMANPKSVINVGFSPYLFSNVNKTDASASIKVWTETLLEERDLRIENQPVFYESTEDMKKALQKNEVDMVSLLTTEFFALRHQVPLDTLQFVVIGGKITEEYLLLVPQDGGVESLTDLQGKTLVLVNGPRMGMGDLWLETRLMENGFSGIDDFFSSCEIEPKSSRSVMSVFFGKLDACLVNRSGYETMVEMNPQIGRALKIVETSPEFIPALICLRASYDPASKKQVADSFLNLHKEARGRQVLTVFKSDRLIAGTDADLATTFDWVEKHALLRKKLSLLAVQTAGVAE